MSIANDTAPTPPAAARLLLIGLWAVKFDVNAKKLIAFTPKMPGDHMQHTYKAGNWQWGKPTNVNTLNYQSNYQVVATGTQNADMRN